MKTNLKSIQSSITNQHRIEDHNQRQLLGSLCLRMQYICQRQTGAYLRGGYWAMAHGPEAYLGYAKLWHDPPPPL